MGGRHKWLADARGTQIRPAVRAAYKELAMQDRRKELRLASNKEVRVIVVRDALIAIGTLRDVSMEGARIELPFSLEPMQKINLIFDDHEQNFQCTVRWCRDNEIGVSFDQPVQLVYSGAA